MARRPDQTMRIATTTKRKVLIPSVPEVRSEPLSWRFPSRNIALRLFITCWLVYSAHFATNVVREVYLALAIGDHFSFRVDEYAHMHPDLFEKKGFGWHIGNNPGASMVAAVPYALARPLIDVVVKLVNEKRAASGQTASPVYSSPWPMARELYQEAWRRGLDIKFGLAAFVMQSLCMAPTSALGVVAMFFLLRRVFGSDRSALWSALLYAFGTAVFFRAGYLNHNMMLGHFAFMGFVSMWNPGGSGRWSSQMRFLFAGFAGGTAVLFDYSGVVFLFGLLAYGVVLRLRAATIHDAFRHSSWYLLGILVPIGLLWFYQWRSFGHPFYPGQHWMPPVKWSDLGYQGYGWPKLELLLALGFDHRYGLFLSSPLILLALFAPWLKQARRLLPNLELAFTLSLFVALWVFFSGNHYTRLQFNTGVRYMAPIIPFLFVPAVAVLMQLPGWAAFLIGVASVTQSWCLAMYRDVERGLGLLDPILHVFFGGFKLPALTTLSRMGGQYGDFFEQGVSPLPILTLIGVILYGVWSLRPEMHSTRTDASGAMTEHWHREEVIR